MLLKPLLFSSLCLALLFGCGEVSLNDEAENQAPSLGETRFELSAGQDAQVAWSLSDADGDAVSVALHSGPAHGSLQLSGGQFQYSPEPGYAGEDRFAVTLSDGQVTTDPLGVDLSVRLPDWLSPVPVCGAGVFAAFTDEAMSPPDTDSENYVIADEADKAAVAASLNAMLAHDGTLAGEKAVEGGYDLCRGAVPEAHWLLWSPKSPGQGKAVWALNWDSRAAGLIVETPHPFHDTDTLKQGVTITQALQARALVSAGTHRCANTTASQCTGRTTVCTGSLADYPESDMAHTLKSRFQAAHEAIAGAFPQDWVVSLHGFSQEGVSLSNGTTSNTTSESPVARLLVALRDQLPQQTLTTCNAFTGQTSENRLCGTTNVQGRHLNGSADACTESAAEASERFIHMEQALTIRQGESEAVIAAFKKALGL